ncbi:hypothetical protein FB567DRAFT_438781 [Paraphoma chrysanthemicola]|uniref:Uncharacterized protein n=1 Tax=Paraphoma chrysanthemicola TaxID=798071 RepID=A0A8K0W0T9_9PLEO|nr:hypothetical protein FB567DRAFT_438781 [Paraphoma chrysanthemicola]
MEASYRARFAPGLCSLRFGVQMGEIRLQHLLILQHHERKAIIEHGPFIDVYLGDTRVYKRTSRTLLFASCPDVGRFLEPMHGQLAICLPQGFCNVLAVKLAVLYMEQFLLDDRVREAPWKVVRDFQSYIALAELFAFIGMQEAAHRLEGAILRAMRERPLRVEHIRAIWDRENALHPSRYAKVMADNILTFACVAKIELFLVEYDIKPGKTYKGRVEDGIRRMADSWQEAEPSETRSEMAQLEQILGNPANVSLKMLVWTTNILAATAPLNPAEWLEIRTLKVKSVSHGIAGMKRVVMRTTMNEERGA